MQNLSIVLFCLCLFVAVNSMVINMFTTTTTDMWGNSRPITSFTVPNHGPNGWDQLLGSATAQSISFNTRPLFNVEPKWGDSIQDMNNPGVWYNTNMAGQISERCTCPGQGIPCSCYKV